MQHFLPEFKTGSVVLKRLSGMSFSWDSTVKTVSRLSGHRESPGVGTQYCNRRSTMNRASQGACFWSPVSAAEGLGHHWPCRYSCHASI